MKKLILNVALFGVFASLLSASSCQNNSDNAVDETLSLQQTLTSQEQWFKTMSYVKEFDCTTNQIVSEGYDQNPYGGVSYAKFLSDGTYLFGEVGSYELSWTWWVQGNTLFVKNPANDVVHSDTVLEFDENSFTTNGVEDFCYTDDQKHETTDTYSATMP